MAAKTPPEVSERIKRHLDRVFARLRTTLPPGPLRDHLASFERRKRSVLERALAARLAAAASPSGDFRMPSPGRAYTLVLLGCGEEKAKSRRAALELYTGQLFRTHLSILKSLGESPDYILSAKYGMLRPQVDIDPYRETLDSKEKRAAWSDSIFNFLHDFQKGWHGSKRILVLAGADYTEWADRARSDGWTVEDPLRGMTLGTRRAFARYLVDNPPEVKRLADAPAELARSLAAFSSRSARPPPKNVAPVEVVPTANQPEPSMLCDRCGFVAAAPTEHVAVAGVECPAGVTEFREATPAELKKYRRRVPGPPRPGTWRFNEQARQEKGRLRIAKKAAAEAERQEKSRQRTAKKAAKEAELQERRARLTWPGQLREQIGEAQAAQKIGKDAPRERVEVSPAAEQRRTARAAKKGSRTPPVAAGARANATPTAPPIFHFHSSEEQDMGAKLRAARDVEEAAWDSALRRGIAHEIAGKKTPDDARRRALKNLANDITYYDQLPEGSSPWELLGKGSSRILQKITDRGRITVWLSPGEKALQLDIAEFELAPGVRAWVRASEEYPNISEPCAVRVKRLLAAVTTRRLDDRKTTEPQKRLVDVFLAAELAGAPCDWLWRDHNG